MRAPGLRSGTGAIIDGFNAQQGVHAESKRKAEDRSRKHKFEDSAEIRREGDYGIRQRQNDRADERHTLEQEDRVLSNEGKSARNRDLEGQYELNTHNRDAEKSTLGIRTRATEAKAEGVIADHESDERMRPIREAEERSQANNNIHQDGYQVKQREYDFEIHKSTQTALLAQNELKRLLSASDQRQLRQRELDQVQELALREIENVFKFAESDPTTAAKMVNDSEIFDIDGAVEVRRDTDGKYRAYDADGNVSINYALNKGQGAPAEWTKSDLDEAMKKAKSGRGSGGSGNSAGVGPKKAKPASEKEVKREVQYILDDHPDADEGEVTEAMSYIRAHTSMDGVTYQQLLDTANNRGLSVTEVARMLSRKYDRK